MTPEVNEFIRKRHMQTNTTKRETEESVRSAYKKIFDWNWEQWGKDYQPLDSTVMQPVFDAIPIMESSEVPEWLVRYLDFCPHCGSQSFYTTDNMASYPEQFIKTICSDCGHTLGMIDNSPYCWWPQFKEYNFEVSI